ncbi:hypothetical protein V6N13_054381 [Hibiscus sabdariffa]|uniref:SWIM-type domain-containing protein n=1 Tax=Hibiscus sabdariffa TaxID=183260 RepID=A0ABR2DXZ9_9ROSI
MDNNSKTFVLQYFHGGKFVSSPSFSYVGSSIEKFQIDPDTTCLWDITGNVKELGYKDDVWVYYRAPGAPFNSDALVLIHDDNTVRQCMDFLNMMGIVDIYVDHMKNYKTLAKDNEVGEGSNKTLITGSSNVQFVEDETREEASADSKEVEREEVQCEEAVVGEKEVSTDSKEVECEEVDCEEVVVGEEEASADSEDFLVNNEVCSDLDEEVEEIRGKLRAGRKITSTESSTDEESSEDNNEDAVEGQTFVGDDTLEGEDVREIEDHESDYIPSDDPGEYGETHEESDDDICGAYRGKGKKSLGAKYDPSCAFPLWEIGFRFEDHKQFKEAVRKYAIAKGVALKFKKSEPKRVRVCCKAGCPWTLFASIDKKLDCFSVKTYYPVHKCSRTNKNPMMNSKHIEKVYKENILVDPKMKVHTLKELCRQELGVYASYSMCQRARKHVLRKQKASYVEEYANLWGYAVELLQSNPGSTVSIQGLVPVINEFFPMLKYRMRARHIYANWHKKWKGMNRKIQFWNCVRSTFVEDFDDQLKISEGMGPTSTNDLLGIPPQHWSCAYFTGESKCDVVDNNLSEAFNGWIVDARCYPIISMLEEIRKMVMQRMHVKRTASSKWKTKIAPRPLQKFERNMDVSNQCKLVWNGDGGFEVTDGGNQHTVDLNNMRCTCREWELTGIPCSHAICAMHHESKDPHTYISNWYTKEIYDASYNHVLQPVRGKIFWSKMNDDPIGPPQFKVMPGRPKKKRRKDKYEPLKPKYGKASKAGYKSASNVQNSQSATNVQSSTTIDVGSTCKGKRQVDVSLYTNLKTGEQTYNPGLPTEMVVTTNKKRKIGAPTSQYQHPWKGPGLQWKGKRAVTTRQLQQQLSDERSQQKKLVGKKLLGTQLSQSDANLNP